MWPEFWWGSPQWVDEEWRRLLRGTIQEILDYCSILWWITPATQPFLSSSMTTNVTRSFSLHLLKHINSLLGYIVSRITLSGNAVNFKAANNEMRFMLRMPWKCINLLVLHLIIIQHDWEGTHLTFKFSQTLSRTCLHRDSQFLFDAIKFLDSGVFADGGIIVDKHSLKVEAWRYSK